MEWITKPQFSEMLLSLSHDNYFDLSTFAFVLNTYCISKQTIDNIIDCLVFDFAITCDAKLVSSTSEVLNNVIFVLNELLTVDANTNNFNEEIK